MSDSIISPAVSARGRRKSADAASTDPARIKRPSVATSALWERLATRARLALLTFDERNALRLLSPVAANLLGLPDTGSVGRSLRLALAEVALIGEGAAALADVVEFPRRLDDDGQTLGVVMTRLGRHVVHAFAVDFESDGARGRALLFEPETPARDEQLDQALHGIVADTLRKVTDAADALRQKSRRADTDTHRALAQTIYADASRLRNILADLRTLRDVREPSASFHPEPLELSDLMMELMAEWQQSAPSYYFELALPGELPPVTADPERVRLAFSSLLRFALAVSASGDTVRLAVRQHDDHVIVSVRTYRGQFADGTLDALLQPFARVAIGAGVVVSLGLELPLTEALVAMHGGAAHIESAAPEPGLVIHVTLPRLPAVARRMAPASAALISVPEPRAQPVSAHREVGVLVAVRDQRLGRYLRANLEAEGYRCGVAFDAREAERRLELDDPELALLDVALADTHPEGTLRHLRSISSAEFLLLAPRHDPVECAQLLDLGAADYIVVPLSLEELLARIRVILRSRDRSIRSAQPSRVFRSGGLMVDFDRRSVTVAERQVALSKTEFKLLRALAEHAGMVLSHEMLLARVWGPGYGQEVEFAWVYVRRLRKKLETDPAHPRYIITVPGVGYKLALL